MIPTASTDTVPAINVVVVEAALLRLAFRFMPKTCVIEGADRAYLLYTTNTPAHDQSFDDLDGEPLTQIRSFADIDQAKRWIQKDILQRVWMLHTRATRVQ